MSNGIGKYGLSNFYAISLTSEMKRQLMVRINDEVNQRRSLTIERAELVCQHLNQCFEPSLCTIRLAMNIVAKLLSFRVAEERVIDSYRKLLCYLSNVIDRTNASELADGMRRISLASLEGGNVPFQAFPVTVTKCIMVLIYQLPIVDVFERKIIHHALRSTLRWNKLMPDAYKQCGFGSLIRCAIVSANNLSDDLAAVTELLALVWQLFDVYYSGTPRSEVHPVDVLLRSAYDRIFSRLTSEWADAKCFALLIAVLYDLLKRPIDGFLKLRIVRLLSDAAGGGLRRLVRLLSIRQHVRADVTMAARVKIVLTRIITQNLFRYECEQNVQRWQELTKGIEWMVNSVYLTELVDARFICLHLPREKLSLENVCFMFIVRHLDVLGGLLDPRTELDYVYNLVTAVNIIYHKRWNVPGFLVKHFIDGMSKFSNHNLWQQNGTESQKWLKAILPKGEPSSSGVNIFGRLPVTIQRIQWIKLQPRGFRELCIVHQQYEFLRDVYIVTWDEKLLTTMQSSFSVTTLMTVIHGKRFSCRARVNASWLLSKRALPGTQLTKVYHNITRHIHKPTDSWMYWARAIYGSIDGMDTAKKRTLWAELTTASGKDNEEVKCLVFELQARLLISMLSEETDSEPSGHARTNNAIEPLSKKQKI
ncbi:uncharacterized protein LOC131215803 [Anopheles bellator]|uniref:uncharacterized protein LOC131215803 n=1 Tax=Anopheles bellator TaxID=139047 RepID=UPI002647235F|nr:uncharacterized protein LOC131215803 [Anopheles bellator]